MPRLCSWISVSTHSSTTQAKRSLVYTNRGAAAGRTHAEIRGGHDGFWVILQEMDDLKVCVCVWGVLGFRVAELCGSVYFVTAGIKAPAETYCSSSVKRQIADGSTERFELFQLTGSLLENTRGSPTCAKPGIIHVRCILLLRTFAGLWPVQLYWQQLPSF